MLKLKKITLTLFISLLICLAAAGIAAGSGGGGGDGTGGANHPELVESSVRDGQEGVAIDVVIDLVFSNNVVHFSIAENNKASFILRDGMNDAVPIEVLMGDEQIDPSIRRNITVAPLAPLKYDTRYTLVILQSLTARNGNSMAADVTLTFTTQSNPSLPQEPQPAPNTPAVTETPAQIEPPTETPVQDEPTAPPAQIEEIARPEAPPDRLEETARPDTPETKPEDRQTSETAEEGPASSARRELRASWMTYAVLAAVAALIAFGAFYFRKR